MGITERREREKLQRQQDIIDAAERLFFTKGFQQTTMDDVAGEAELSKGTLYLYFKSKEEIYLAITYRGLVILEEMFRNAIENQSTGLKKVLALGQAFYEFSKRYPDYFNAISYYELKESQGEVVSDVIRECSCAGHESLSILVETLQSGILDGSVRPDVDPKRMALMMWGMTSGIIQLASLKGKHIALEHGFDVQGIVENSFELFRCVIENKKPD